MVDVEKEAYQVASLLLKGVKEGFEQLSDEQLDQILSVDEKQLKDLLYRLWAYSLGWCRSQKRYRVRRRELEQKSTEELQAMRSEIHSRRLVIMNEVDDDDLEDSFFEPPPIDSDEHIAYELLKERGALT